MKQLLKASMAFSLGMLVGTIYGAVIATLSTVSITGLP